MELVLPNNYVEIEEGMMYLDGGYGVNMSRGFVANLINGAIVVLSAGVGLFLRFRQFIRYFGKYQVKSFITTALTKVGIYNSMAYIVVDAAMDLLTFSIGGAVAYALDRFDRTGLNGGI